jgi:signal transduction histidine kinase/ActR/RegA family two-component response regulator
VNEVTRWGWLGDSPDEGAAAAMRAVDWNLTTLGPVETWSASLKGLISMMMLARQPMVLWWGPDLVQFYNDGYVPSFGVGRHPAAMGQRGEDCWGEIWATIGPEIATVLTGKSTFHEDALVPVFRNGRMEEVYWTYGFSPVLEGDGSIAGVLVIVTETTSRVVALRRLRMAQTLAETLSLAAHPRDVANAAVRALATTREDAPWALAYRTSAVTGEPEVIASSGLAGFEREVADRVRQDLGAPSSSDQPRLIDLSAIQGLPGGPWPEPSTQAVAVSLRGGSRNLNGQLVVGLSPRLPYDQEYQHLAVGLARQLASAVERIDSHGAQIAAEGARNDLLMQAPVAAALMVGPAWNYQLANRAYVRMVGREVVGRNWRDCFPELCGGPVEAILQSVYSEGKTFFASEQLVPLARESDGVVEERFFDFNMIPVRSNDGSIDAMMVVATEISAQVLARRDLERTGREREALVRDLKEAARAKDEFLAMLGHELRNPLSPISTAVAVMRQKPGRDTTREQAVIERQVGHLVRLVDDLLDVSRVTRGKIDLRRSVSKVSALVDNAVEMVAGPFAQRRHELRVSVQPGLNWHGDATRIEQVMANLLTNSARYTDPGGHVSLTASEEDGELVIRVCDDGRGLSAELLPKLFEPFVQGERGSDRHEGGLGLGLALVKALVELHGGSVTAHSDGPGRGSEFVVRVPGLTTKDSDAHDTHPKPSASVANLAVRHRILFVDDNKDAATLSADLLQMDGHDVAVAHDGPAAVVVAEQFRPTVAFLDIGLPGMDGYELVGRLRGIFGDCCRFIALTGYGQREDRERAAQAGFDELLVKPVDIDVLNRILRETAAAADLRAK